VQQKHCHHASAPAPTSFPLQTSLVRHTQNFEKNIFTSLYLSKTKSDQLTKTECSLVDMTKSDYHMEKEISPSHSNKSPLLSFSATEQKVESPTILSGTCLTAVAGITPEVIKVDHSEQSWQTDSDKLSSKIDALSYTSVVKSSLSKPEVDDLLHNDIKPVDSISKSLLDLNYSAAADATLSNCSDNIFQALSGTVSDAVVSVAEPSISADSILPKQKSDLHGISSLSTELPSGCSIAKDCCTPVVCSSESSVSCSLLAANDNFSSESHAYPHMHCSQTSVSESSITKQALPIVSCTPSVGSLPSSPAVTSNVLLTKLQVEVPVISRPVPVSLFCAQSCTVTSTPIPVALFCARSCGSVVTPQNSQVIGSDAVRSSLVAVSVSVSTDAISHTAVQHRLAKQQVTVKEETEKSVSDDGCEISAGSVVNNSFDNDDTLSLSESASVSTLLAPADDPEQCSISSDESYHSHHPVATSVSEMKHVVKDSNDPNITDSDTQPLPITSLTDISCQLDKHDELDVLNIYGSNDDGPKLPQLPVTNELEAECQMEEPDISDEPNEYISDEQIVSQILEADSCQCESLDCVLTKDPLSALDSSEHQKWREMLPPVTSNYEFSKTSAEHDSDDQSLCDVVSEDASSDSLVEELIHSTELNVSQHHSGTQDEQCENHDVVFLPTSHNDDWISSPQQLQDVLCSLLSSCHVNSVDDDDNCLPLVDASDEANDDAVSCSSSCTEVYSNKPEDQKLDGVGSQCASPQDGKDSDGTVSPLSVVLDGDGLDLMDSTSDGFQNIYSSLVSPTQMDAVLGSDAGIMNNGVYSDHNQPTTNLSPFSVEHSLTDGRQVVPLLDREHSPAVTAADAGLVKNLPSSTAAVTSLCDRLEESRQLSNRDEGDGQTDDEAKTEKNSSMSFECSQPHATRKSCRSSLRMRDKLANIDTSPSLAVQHDGCQKPRIDTYHADAAESLAISPTSSEGVNHVHGRKWKQVSDLDDKNKADGECLSSDVVTEIHEKSSSSAHSKTTEAGKKRRNSNLTSVKPDRDRITSKKLRAPSVIELDKSVSDDASVLYKRHKMPSEVHPAKHSIMASERGKTQTVFTVEQARSGSVRTIILTKPAFLPVISAHKKCKLKQKLDQIKGQQKLIYRQICHDTEEKEKKQLKSAEEQDRQMLASDGDRHEDVLGDLCKSQTSKRMRGKKKKKVSMETGDNRDASERRLTNADGLDKDSKDTGNMISHDKSDNGSVVHGSDILSDRGRSWKKHRLLAELANSEGYVADKTSRDTGRRLSRSLSSDGSMDDEKNSRIEEREQVKPRGRPRKHYLLAELEDSEGYVADKSLQDSGRRLSHSKSSERSEVDGKSGRSEERDHKRPKGRPRKHYLLAELEDSEGYVAERHYQDTGSGLSHNKSSEEEEKSSNSRGRPRKKCSLLGEPADSEGYVAGKSSRNTRRKSSCNKSDNESVVSDNSTSRERPKKTRSLLAELANSEGYVAERNASQHQDENDVNCLLWSDTCTLSREERALQVCTGGRVSFTYMLGP